VETDPHVPFFKHSEGFRLPSRGRGHRFNPCRAHQQLAEIVVYSCYQFVLDQNEFGIGAAAIDRSDSTD